MNLSSCQAKPRSYIYTLTEDAALAGFEIAPNSVQFKLETVDDGIFLFRPRKCGRTEWVRADKLPIQMIRRSAAPRGHVLNTNLPTPTDARCNFGAHLFPRLSYLHRARCRPSRRRRWFPAAGYCGLFPLRLRQVSCC